MILFAAIYCVVMFLLYFVGTVFYSTLCASKALFPQFWTSSHELQRILSGVATFMLHYVLLWIGYKKGFLDRFIIRALKILDLVFYGSPFALLIFFCFCNMTRLLPLFATNCIIIILRLLTSKKISEKLQHRTGDGSLP